MHSLSVLGSCWTKRGLGHRDASDELFGLFASNQIPTSNTILMISGSVGFELALKAVLAGIPFIAALGAPTNLFVDLYEMASHMSVSSERLHSTFIPNLGSSAETGHRLCA